MRRVPGNRYDYKYEFTPGVEFEDESGKVFKNRELPAEERITVVIRSPTAAEKRYAKSSALRADGGFSDDHCYRMACQTNVVSVSNYMDANGNAIANGYDLAAHGETPLVREVGSEIIAGLYLASIPEEDQKNSEGSSGSTT